MNNKTNTSKWTIQHWIEGFMSYQDDNRVDVTDVPFIGLFKKHKRWGHTRIVVIHPDPKTLRTHRKWEAHETLDTYSYKIIPAPGIATKLQFIL